MPGNCPNRRSMIARATPLLRHSGSTAIEASSSERSRCGLTCPQPMRLPFASTATMNRCQLRPVGLIPTRWMIRRIVLASADVAGRNENPGEADINSIACYFYPSEYIRQDYGRAFSIQPAKAWPVQAGLVVFKSAILAACIVYTLITWLIPPHSHFPALLPTPTHGKK